MYSANAPTGNEMTRYRSRPPNVSARIEQHISRSGDRGHGIDLYTVGSPDRAAHPT